MGFFRPASLSAAASSSFEEAIAGISPAAEDRKPCGGAVLLDTLFAFFVPGGGGGAVPAGPLIVTPEAERWR